MRFKRRYFCVEIIYQDDQINASDKIKLHKLKHTNLTETVHSSIEKFYGDYGMAVMMPSFSVIYFNSNTNLAIMRTARDLQKKFHNLLTFTRKLDQFEITFRVVHVSGSIKKCKKFLLKYCQDKLSELNIQINQNKTIEPMNEDNQMAIEVYEKLFKASQSNDNTFSVK